MSAAQEASPAPVAARREQARGAQTLLSRIRPALGESLLSLVSAAAAANRLPAVRDLLGLVGAPYSQELLHGRPDIYEPLARLIGVEPGEIGARSYGPQTLATGTRMFFGTRVPADWISTGKRLAPGVAFVLPRAAGKVACGHSAAWDLALLDTCPDTGVKLVGHCPRPGCGQRFYWNLSNIGACSSCTLDLASKGGRYAEQLPEGVLGGVRFVADLLCPWRGAAASAIARLPDPLSFLGRVELVHLLLLLQELAPEAQRFPGQPCPRKMRSRRTHAQLAAGMAILEGWPGALHDTLDRLRALGAGQGRSGVTGLYGPTFAAFLRKLREDASDGEGGGGEARRILLDGIAPYFAARQEVSWRRDSALGTLLGENSVGTGDGEGMMNLKEAGRQTGWASPRLGRLLKSRPDLILYDGGGVGAPTLVRTRALLEAVKTVEAGLAVNKCCRQIGISRLSCVRLVTSGLLRPVSEAHVALSRTRVETVKICPKSLAELLARLEAGARTSRSARTMTLRGAALAATSCFPETNWERLIRGMLDGRLPYYRSEKERHLGLPYVMDADCVAAFLRAARDDGPLDNMAIAAELGLTQRTMVALARAGVAQILPGRGARKQWLYPKEQVEQLKVKILPTKGVATKLGLPEGLATLHRLPATLRRCGIRPLVGENGDANYIWPSQDVDALRQQILDEWDTEATRRFYGPKRGRRLWQATRCRAAAPSPR